jgi:hypothetical protein
LQGDGDSAAQVLQRIVPHVQAMSIIWGIV